MRSLLGGMAAVVLLAGLGGLAFMGARYLQALPSSYQRLEGPTDCDLRDGPCVQPVHSGRLSLSIAPAEIPLMETLVLEVGTHGLPADAVMVEIRGLNMDMGLNRTALHRTGDQVWRGETILPVCSQRRMDWEAAVQVDAGQRFEVPFLFATTRP